MTFWAREWLAFRGDAAFAKPDIYEAAEERGVKYAIRLSGTEENGNSKKRSRAARKKNVVGEKKKGTRKRAAATKLSPEKSNGAADEGALGSVTGLSGDAGSATDPESGLQDTAATLRPTDAEEGEKKKIWGEEERPAGRLRLSSPLRNRTGPKDLLEKAIQRVKEKLDNEKDLSPGIIGNVVQLLKLDRDLFDEEEVVKEIRVLWEEINGDTTDE